MKLDYSPGPIPCPVDTDILAAAIAAQQLPNGQIPWCEGGKTDPWDHVESAIGLTIGGYYEEARRAFAWLADIQHADGSWCSAYQGDEILDPTRESNMSSYLAAGVFHHYLVTGDQSFLKRIWSTMEAGIEYALNLQTPDGEIYWARNKHRKTDPMALLTGCSSIYMSLKCALVLAWVLGKSRPRWESAMERLGKAIRCRPELFDQSKARYSMDWFYPVLCGAVTGEAAERRLEERWNRFMVHGMGVRCVSDSPWVTMAETSELIMALNAMGRTSEAHTLFIWLSNKCYPDGTFWCGVTFPEMVVWTDERLTWTNAAVMMAADALFELTPASHLFNHTFWRRQHPEQPHVTSVFTRLTPIDGGLSAPPANFIPTEMRI